MEFDKNIIQKFKNYSMRTAYVYQGISVTYIELAQKIEQAMFTIKTSNINHKIIAIALNRTDDWLYLIYAILILGYTYLPIDIEQPCERIEKMLSDKDISLLIINSETSHRFSFETCANRRVMYTDEIQNTIINNDEIFIKCIPNPCAYVIFTSGSTGEPKGIEVSRKGINNFTEGINSYIQFEKKDIVISFTNVAFDIFFMETIVALYYGSKVVFADDNESKNPKLMKDLIIKNNVTAIQMTPSMMQLLLCYDKKYESLKKINKLMLGGEKFPQKLLNIIRDYSTAKIFNLYGPTETTIWSTVSDLSDKNYVDVGYPIKDTKIYIIDENKNILNKNLVGEICIGGKGVALGYRKNRELTNEKFIHLRLANNERVFRTGDIGMINENNVLECYGRLDNQVKIRGHRIEIEEIEEVVNRLSGIDQAFVFTKIEEEECLILGYLGENKIKHENISRYMMRYLPSYMIPRYSVKMDKFYYTNNGKLDRKNTYNYYLSSYCVKNSTAVAVNEGNNIEDKVLRTIAQLLDCNPKLSDNFTELGMDSITFVRLIVELEDIFNFEFEDNMLLRSQFNDIHELVEYVRDNKIK